LNSEERFVVFGINSREGMDSCSYDRDYLVYPLRDLEDSGKVKGEFTGVIREALLSKVKVTGINMNPKIVIVEDEAPFEVARIITHEYRRRKKETITIYK
jgi:hypothetical protein